MIGLIVYNIQHFISNRYRYGFNGMEREDEAGQGNYTTFFRQYDSRLGKWLSIDPKARKYPNQSPYVAFNNNPICFTDPFGDDPPEEGWKYEVKEGDNLSKIADEYNVTVDDLVQSNEEITNENKDLIHVGDKIHIPRWIGVSKEVTNNSDIQFEAKFGDSPKLWSDSKFPDEVWQKRDGEWVDLANQPYVESATFKFVEKVSHNQGAYEAFAKVTNLTAETILSMAFNMSSLKLKDMLDLDYQINNSERDLVSPPNPWETYENAVIEMLEKNKK